MSTVRDIIMPDLTSRPHHLTVERDMAAPPGVLYPAWIEQIDGSPRRAPC